MASFEDPTQRAWETPEEIVKRLFQKREINSKDFTKEDKEKLLKLFEALDSQDDVNDIYTNADIES